MSRNVVAVPTALKWLVILATALVLHKAIAYRPFPSFDDFSKIPQAWAILDPTLYGTDYFIQEYLEYNPIWPGLIWLLDMTVGLPTGLWVATLLLSVATVAATGQILKTLSGDEWLLPLVAVLALGGAVQGIGRGAFDGMFGAAFHMQWLALCLCLWSYSFFLQGRYWPAGGMISCVFYIHPVVAVHGLGALLVAALLVGRGSVKPLGQLLALPVLVATPFVLWLLLATQQLTALSVPVEQIIRDGYLFRAPHEYALEDTPPFLALIFGTLIVAGFAGLMTPHKHNQYGPGMGLTGLMLGHLLLLLAAVVFHTELISDELPYVSLLPYKLHLTRTTPLFVVLAGIAFAGAFKPGYESSVTPTGTIRLHWVIYWTMWTLLLVAVAAFQVRWQAFVIVLLVLAASSMLARKVVSWRWLLVPWLGLVVAAGHGVASTDRFQLALEPDESELYEWIATDTNKRALFIVPPGMQEFRFFARRSAYVAFKLFPNAKPDLVIEWRRRMEEVAAPDKLALTGRGFPVLAEWDRCYANRNTPSRIADLLQNTGADYFVWDSHGLQIPPFIAVARDPDDRVQVAFQNDRYVVYRLTRRGEIQEK